ncbi:MAG: glycosyltransferase family 2 protein [Fusobacteriaceae bacterium]
MITLNEEKNLERTLKAVEGLADEIIIVDSGSTDKTVLIAEKFGAKVIFQKWLGYGQQRNIAIENSSGEWILCIDADEEIQPKLSKKIKEIINCIDENSKEVVFEIKMISVCFGKILRYGGWGECYSVRFFKKGKGYFNSNDVHEEFVTDCKILKIEEHLLHYSYLTLEEYFSRFNRYTTEGALEYYSRGKKSSVTQIIFNPIYKFLRMYIFRLGFLDGIEGLMISVTSSLYSMVKYFKLREIYRNNSYKK